MINASSTLAGIAVLWCLVASAAADVGVNVQLGWNDRVRPFSDNPVAVVVTSEGRREVVLEWVVSDARGGIGFERMPAVLNPGRQTFRHVLPIEREPWATHLRVADAGTNRTLARWPHEPFKPGSFARRVLDAEALLVVTTGPAASGVGHQAVRVTPESLPADPRAYASADAVVLAWDDVMRVDIEAQAALAAWVRAGGVLWVVPAAGVGPSPGESPLAVLLGEAGLAPDSNDILSEVGAGRVGVGAADGLSDVRLERPSAGNVFDHAVRTNQPDGQVETARRGGLAVLAMLVLLGPLDAVLLGVAGNRRRAGLWASAAACVAAAGWVAAGVVGGW